MGQNKTIELVNAWGSFEVKYPDATIEDFCRHYLVSTKKHANNFKLDESLPPTIDGRLMRLMGRIFRLHSLYTTAAIEGTGLKTVEEYSLLNLVYISKEPRKTEAIYSGFYELSTGTDMLRRLQKLGYTSEHNDVEDKRSKRIKVTAKGEKIVLACRERIMQVAEMMLHDLGDDDKLLCLQILQNVETKFAGVWQSHKSKSFKEIYAQVIDPAKL